MTSTQPIIHMVDDVDINFFRFRVSGFSREAMKPTPRLT